MLDESDIQTMLEACGVTATLDATGETLLVSPPEYGHPQVIYSGSDLEQMNPVCQASSADVATLGISGGESGTLITVMGRSYRVLAIEADTPGFSSIELGAV